MLKINLIEDGQNIISKYYPFLSIYGIPPGALHSFLISLLIKLGTDLKFSAISEMYIKDKEHALFSYRKGGKIPDCIWMNKEDGAPKVLFEVERTDTIRKMKNLIISAEDIYHSYRKQFYKEVKIKFFVIICYKNPKLDIRAILSTSKGFREGGVNYEVPNYSAFLIIEVKESIKNDRLINLIFSNSILIFRGLERHL